MATAMGSGSSSGVGIYGERGIPERAMWGGEGHCSCCKFLIRRKICEPQESTLAIG